MSKSSGTSKKLVADRRYGKTSASRKPARKPKRKRAAPTGRGPLGLLTALVMWVLRLVFRITATVVILATVVVVGMVFFTKSTLPEYDEILDGRARGSVTLLDRQGKMFARRGDQYGGAVTADSVSVHLKNAVVATEDKRFYQHLGVSPRGVASAIRINLREGRGPLSGHGGSTITQQTAKLLCLGVVFDPDQWASEAEYVADCRRSSLQRKAKEALYALAMEAKYTKNEILSIYINRAYMGGGAYGAEAAAHGYFSKPASQLNPAEAAMIAGLLTAPTRLAPTSNLKRSQDRAATVLRLMNEQGMLSDADTAFYQQNPAVLSAEAQTETAGYFADWVMQTGPDFFTKDTTEDVVIQTTLDPAIQRATDRAVTKTMSALKAGSKAEVAVVVMSADGAVRAMVGGRDVSASGVFNRATQAVRQTGSAFKPFVYATALELGYSPIDTVVDERFCMDIPGSGQWCPENYTKEFKGRVTLADALKHSLNIPAVKVSEFVGRDLVMKVATDFGLWRDLSDTPSLALGSSEATLLEMTGAYAGILNGGSSVTPYGLIELRLKGDPTPLMGSGGGIGERVISEDAARQLVWMMEKVITEGTGRRAALKGYSAAGKTGTSQEARDAWFIGFTADYVAGVWMGYDDNTPLSGVTGGGLPAQIWHDVMTAVQAPLPARSLPSKAPPKPVVQAKPQQQQQQQPRRQAPAQTQRQQKRDKSETLLQQLLRDILGGN